MGRFQADYHSGIMRVTVDGRETLSVQEDQPAFDITLSKDQLSLMKRIPGIQHPIHAFLDKVETPYRYRWTAGLEEYDGALTFRLPLGSSTLLYVIIPYGEREAHGQENRKRLLLLTRLSRGEQTIPKAQHGYTTVRVEPVGTDHYTRDASLVMLIREANGRKYYTRGEYPKVPTPLREFVAMHHGNPQTQSDFIQGGWDRLVIDVHLQETEKLVKYALLRLFI